MSENDSQCRRSRFSLRSLLIVTVIAVLGLTVWKLYADLTPLQAEVRKLRSEVGALYIDDESKFHAIQMPSDDEYTWKWRIWIPVGRRYRVSYVGEQIPAAGQPSSPSRLSLTLAEPGEHVVQYQIRADAQLGAWTDRLIARSAGVGSTRQDWVSWGSKTSTTGGVGKSTEIFEPAAGPIVLARHRVSQTASNSGNIEDPSAGFMVWLDPVP